MHLSNPNKYTLKFVVETWGQLNARWVESLKGIVNRLCLLKKVERPTFEELKETGIPLDQHGGNIFHIPNTFDLSDPTGYFQHTLLGALERDFERARWDQYYKVPGTVPNRNAGEEPTSHGPSLTTKERRLCALNAPKTIQGNTICWDFNTHGGCLSPDCPRQSAGGHVQFRNFETLCKPLKMYLLRKGGLKRTRR